MYGVPSAVLRWACLAACVFSGTPTRAWDRHDRITQASLSELPALRSQSVRCTSLDSLVHDLGFSSLRQFNESLQIRKEYAFAPKLGEREGGEVPVLEVLAAYSDEPDWGMDKEIFGEYPELWRPEYAFMGGKEGTPSQSFRHMYWPAFRWRMPIRTFKLPLAKLLSSMGLAPDRAALFMDLSGKAKKLGHPYWSARFAANALHYLEDAAQPFHASQVPMKRFTWMPLGDREHGQGIRNYVLQVQNIVAYYHYSFERYIGHLLQADSAGDNSPEGKRLVRALAGTGPAPAAPAGSGETIADLVVEMARFAVQYSDRAGRASLEFFPKIQSRFDGFDPDQTVQSDSWWKETLNNSRMDSSVKQEYFRIVETIFSRLGTAVRAAVKQQGLPPSGS